MGYVIFPYFILPRTKTKQRLLRKIKGKIKEYKKGKITMEKLNQTIQSYYGFLSHANTAKNSIRAGADPGKKERHQYYFS